MQRLNRFLSLVLLAFVLAVVTDPASAQSVRKQGTITTQNLVPAGTCTAGGCVEIDVASRGAVTVQVTGTYTGALSGQATTDGVTWVTLAASGSFTNVASGATAATIGSGTAGLFRVSGVVGAMKFRIAALAAVTGTATITLQTAPVPPESSTTISGGAGDASAANQATQITAEQAIQAAVEGTLDVAGTGVAGTPAGGVLSVQGVASGTALPVSGTVAATQSGTWNARVQDGSGNAITSAARGAERAVSVQIVDGSGAQITSFGGSGGTASNFGSAVPSAGTAMGASDGTNMQNPRVFDTDTGGGTQYTLGVNIRLGASGGGIELVGGAGANAAGVLRVNEATDSQLSAGVGATGDAAATAGSTGSINAKLRLMTTQLATLDTSINASNDQLPTALGQTTMANSLSVALASNQSNVPANIAQINGVTPLMGAGNGGTGSQRVNIATDQAAIATHGHGATGAAVPSGAQQMGARTGANMEAVAQGATTVAINVSTATTTQLVALSGSTQIRVTGLAVIAGGTGNITFVYGTGTNCGTGTTSLSGAIPLIANAGLTLGSGLGPVLIVPAGQALCVTTSAAVQMSGFVTYAQY